MDKCTTEIDPNLVPQVPVQLVVEALGIDMVARPGKGELVVSYPETERPAAVVVKRCDVGRYFGPRPFVPYPGSWEPPA